MVHVSSSSLQTNKRSRNERGGGKGVLKYLPDFKQQGFKQSIKYFTAPSRKLRAWYVKLLRYLLQGLKHGAFIFSVRILI